MHYSNYAPSLTRERFRHFQCGYSVLSNGNILWKTLQFNATDLISVHTLKRWQQWLFAIQCMSSEYTTSHFLLLCPTSRVTAGYAHHSRTARVRHITDVMRVWGKIFLWYHPTARLIFGWHMKRWNFPWPRLRWILFTFKSPWSKTF